MKGENIKRIRILKLWEILNQETDVDHPISTEELVSKLNALGIECNRKTIYEDVETLNNFGYEVMKERGKRNTYYVSDRTFDDSELHMLMDAVQASRSITESKTEDLCKKIAALSGNRRAEILAKNVVTFYVSKSGNESIFYNVSEINYALECKKKIEFKYFRYDLNRNKLYSKDKTDPSKPKTYLVSPLATVFADDSYYLIAYDDNHDGITHYRIDRMESVIMKNEPISDRASNENFDVISHKKELFGMFSGESELVTFQADVKLVDVIFDHFGASVKITKLDENTVTFTQQVQTSPMFVAWCCTFGDRLKVVAPQSAIDKIKTNIAQVSSLYK